MSTNIDAWQTKELADLVIPLRALYALPEVSVYLLPGLKVKAVGLAEGFRVTGVLQGDESILVDGLETRGEHSGSSWDDFCAMLKQSKGKLVAIQVWERGMSITKLTAEEGRVVVERVNL